MAVDMAAARPPVIPPVIDPAVLPIVHQTAAGAGSVLASFTGGLAVGGVVVGIFAGLATVTSLVIFAFVTIRSARRDRDQEIRDAEKRGEDRQKQWTDYYKDLAEGHLRLPPIPGDGDA